jgi:hypothetical protein
LNALGWEYVGGGLLSDRTVSPEGERGLLFALLCDSAAAAVGRAARWAISVFGLIAIFGSGGWCDDHAVEEEDEGGWESALTADIMPYGE